MKYIVIVFLLFQSIIASASYILVPMDEHQTNHLKAYGLAYWTIAKGVEVDWLLNYKGGSFAMPYNKLIEAESRIRGVSFEVLPDAKYSLILMEIANPEKNMDLVKLEKAPKIAVYTPINKPHHPELPWDDAVTLALDYAEIPYDKIYDEDVLNEKLPLYDWLHLHHEDFTGQYGKFYRSYRNQPWYIAQVKYEEEHAKSLGFNKVSQMKLAVVHKIRDYVAGGGFMFAMCSATDTYDIALSAEGIDICDRMFDGDGAEPNASSKLDYHKTFAFDKFQLVMDPLAYEFSTIDVSDGRKIPENLDFFTLFDFSAKWDPVPTMLTQCHTKVIKGFMGQTTAFHKNQVKSSVLVMGENKLNNEVRYIHGEYGYGFWTFFGGHDPEDYQHFVGEPATDLNLHPNSPGYRLILNNVLFPAAKKKKQKT
ncbi:MAG: hypothetical protein R2798_09070 [Chitinophagales bacterium]|nr:asparagine synthetase B [Bacteroidota bacterium]MCB9043896.1 asparagine synthetase B [Chitinophagales bacterium]